MRVVCDCDNTFGLPGKPIDDGQTLLYLLHRPDIELLGVTTTFGNGTIDEVERATRWLLQAAGRPDIPVLRGAAVAGDHTTEAARFLADIAATYAGDLHLLAIGPQTNLHAAALRDPDFFRNLVQIASMGGYRGPLTAPGWKHVHEVNLSSDPEAAHSVLHAPCPVALMSAQTCLDAPFGRRELARLAEGDAIFYQVQRDFLQFCADTHQMPSEYLWDLLPAVYLSAPTLFDDAHARVCSSLADLRDGIIVLGDAAEAATVRLPMGIRDQAAFYEMLYGSWTQVLLNTPPSNAVV